jgi:hypothetical protein
VRVRGCERARGGDVVEGRRGAGGGCRVGIGSDGSGSPPAAVFVSAAGGVWLMVAGGVVARSASGRVGIEA